MACLFCEIVAGRIPAKIAHQDDRIVAFHDINPQAPVHILLVPRTHITSLLDLTPEDDELLGALTRTARDLARANDLDTRGFRLVFNCGVDAGYSVFHVHLHLLGGRTLAWPPG